SGSNYWRWEAALKLYAQLNACDDLLNGVWVEPTVAPANLQQEPDSHGSTTIPDQSTLDTAVARVRANNDEEYKRLK
ncbi:hypothetical protein E8E12_000173, partial [Didymella heteroderae]